MNNNLKSILLKELKRKKYNGIAQYEIETLYNFSRSHISETITNLLNENIIVRKTTGKLTKMIWLFDYYPDIIPGYIRIGILKSSEYALFLSMMNEISETDGFKIKILVFNSTAELMEALINNSIELCLSPLFSQFISALIHKNILLLGPVASGGSFILENKNYANNDCYTSKVSSMMLLTKEFIKSGNTGIKTFDNPAMGIRQFENNEGRYITIWEPYASTIDDKYVKIKTYGDLLDDYPCCFISTNQNYYMGNAGFVNNLIMKYRSYNHFDEKIIKFISKMTKIKENTIKNSLNNYNYRLKFTRSMNLIIFSSK